MTASSRVLPWLIYPVVVTLAFGLFALLQMTGAPLVVSTYVPVLATAAIVTLLEWVSALPTM